MRAYGTHLVGCHCDACERARASDPETYVLGHHLENPNYPSSGAILDQMIERMDLSPGSIHTSRYDGGQAAHLPASAAERKAMPVATGFIDYFPDAVAAVAQLSQIGNDQHNPGKPLFWDRSKSGDEADALMRHFLDRGTLDTDGVRHSAKVAWRAMALLQKEIEAERAKPSASDAVADRSGPVEERPFPWEYPSAEAYRTALRQWSRRWG